MTSGKWIMMNTAIAYILLGLISKRLGIFDMDFVMFWLVICAVADLADDLRKKERNRYGRDNTGGGKTTDI